MRVFKKFFNNPRLSILFLIAIYITTFSYLSIKRLLSLHSHYYDLGIMDQVIYNTSRGRFFQMTHPDLGVQISRIGIHFDPIMTLIAPLYIIKPTPEILLITQTCILALGAIPVYLIAKKVLKSQWISFIFVILYLNYYPLQLSNLFDFHAVTFATTSLLFAFYFLAFNPLKKAYYNILAASFFISIVLLTKESTPFTIIFLCGYLLLIKKNKIFSLVLIGICILLLIATVVFLMPFFRGMIPFGFDYYDFQHPMSLVKQFFSFATFNYIFQLLSPLGFFPIFAPLQLAIAVPELALNLLSSNSNMRELYFHYTALITPFLIISSIYGFANLKKLLPFFSKNQSTIFGCFLLMISIFCNYKFGLPHFIPPPINKPVLQEILTWRDKLQNDQLKISTTGTIAPFFTEHEFFYNFLFDPSYQKMDTSTIDLLQRITKYDDADYVIIYKPDIIGNYDPVVADYYEDLRENKKFRLIEDKNSIQIFKKI